jgi:hypothetical protein
MRAHMHLHELMHTASMPSGACKATRPSSHFLSSVAASKRLMSYEASIRRVTHRQQVQPLRRYSCQRHTTHDDQPHNALERIKRNKTIQSITAHDSNIHGDETRWRTSERLIRCEGLTDAHTPTSSMSFSASASMRTMSRRSSKLVGLYSGSGVSVLKRRCSLGLQMLRISPVLMPAGIKESRASALKKRLL